MIEHIDDMKEKKVKFPIKKAKEFFNIKASRTIRDLMKNREIIM